MRYHAVLLTVLFACLRVFGDVGLSLGSTGSLSLPGVVPAGEVRAGADGEILVPLAGGLAFLGDAAADARYLPAEALLVASGQLTADLSLERDSFLARIEVAGVGQASASLAGGAAEPPTGEASAGVLASWGGRVTSIRGEAVLRLLGGDRIAWGPRFRAQLSGEVGGSLVLSLDAACDLDVPAAGGAAEPVVSAGATAEWFLDAPLVLRASAGFERRVSTAAESVAIDGAAVDVPGYWGYAMARGGLHASVLVGNRGNLSVDVPASLRIADHLAITGTVLLAEREWRVEVGPEVSVGVQLSRQFGLRISVSDVLAFSNAAAATNDLSATVEARVSLP